MSFTEFRHRSVSISSDDPTFLSDSNHTEKTAKSSDFRNSQSNHNTSISLFDIIQSDADRNEIKLDELTLGPCSDTYNFFEDEVDIKPDSPIHFKSAIRKERKQIIPVSPNSYQPPIEIKKPINGDIAKNALKDRLQQLSTSKRSECDVSFTLSEFDDTHFPETVMECQQSPMNSMKNSIKKICFFSPKKRSPNNHLSDKSQQQQVSSIFQSVVRKCFSSEELHGSK